MSLAHPLWLLGTLAVLIPLLIHLWSQKRGKQVAWAAMKFLPQVDHLRSRGWRLNHILLLLVRCAMIMLLSLILTGLFLKNPPFSTDKKIIHLVETDSQLLANFAFELEQAKTAGECVYGIGQKDNSFEAIADFDKIISAPHWISALHELEADEVHLYLSSTSFLLPKQPIDLPYPIIFHVYDKLDQDFVVQKKLQLPNNQSLFISQSGELTLDESNSVNAIKNIPISKLYYAHDFTIQEEINTIHSMIRSIEEVYDLELEEAGEGLNSTRIKLFFTDQQPEKVETEVLYFVFGHVGHPSHPQIIQLAERPHPSSKWVKDGTLPERILDGLLQHLGLEKQSSQLSMAQIKAHFNTPSETKASNSFPLKTFLFVLLIIFTGIERSMAIPRQL
ncbi:BatA domain-containing protein [Pararhodonellum marinum]|uniref:BatA domain-containing protein n=1 Tax=Pararhodonellum marinum TaxID=2755358 RepID=UPI00188EDEFF|nr:BatA domain-containing protein [Pararhodonellum marinum]